MLTCGNDPCFACTARSIRWASTYRRTIANTVGTATDDCSFFVSTSDDVVPFPCIDKKLQGVQMTQVVSLRSFRHHDGTTDKHNLSVHLLPLTRFLVLCKPGSMRKAVPNGLRTPTVRALPDIKVPVRTVRPAAQTIPLNIVTLVFMVRSVAQTRSYCSTGTSLFMLRSVAQTRSYCSTGTSFDQNLTLDKSRQTEESGNFGFHRSEFWST